MIWRVSVLSLLLLALTVAGRRVHRIDNAFWRSGREHAVDPLLLKAVAWQESRLRPDARGAAGEIGMMQIMPNTARHWAERTGQPVPDEKQLFRIRLNTSISAWYLRQGLDEFADTEDPLVYALAYYNAGPSRARAWRTQRPEEIPFTEFIPFPSTRRYVTNILQAYRGS